MGVRISRGAGYRLALLGAVAAAAAACAVSPAAGGGGVAVRALTDRVRLDSAGGRRLAFTLPVAITNGGAYAVEVGPCAPQLLAVADSALAAWLGADPCAAGAGGTAPEAAARPRRRLGPGQRLVDTARVVLVAVPNAGGVTLARALAVYRLPAAFFLRYDIAPAADAPRPHPFRLPLAEQQSTHFVIQPPP